MMLNMTQPNNDQSSNKSAEELTTHRFPPLPLISGNAFVDADGTHRVTQVTVTLTGEDGATCEVPLEYRFGGWWADGLPTPQQ